MSDAIPNFHTVADEMAVINSVYTDQFNHAPAELLVYTGSSRSGRPSMGSWVSYGLGTENENMPGFVVLISSGVQPNGGRNSYGSGFYLPYSKESNAAPRAILYSTHPTPGE